MLSSDPYIVILRDCSAFERSVERFVISLDLDNVRLGAFYKS